MHEAGSPASAAHQAALAMARNAPTRHVPRLVTRQDVGAMIHGTSAVGRFNRRVAVVITRAVGTMWAVIVGPQEWIPTAANSSAS
jgi:hypothetical protein